MELESCLYECQVMHHRMHPKKHRFVYRLFLFGIELNEVETLANQLTPLSYNRFNLFSFYDRDHMQSDDRSARQKIISHCREHGVECPEDARVFLVTMPRIAGYIFNPVSFYFILTIYADKIVNFLGNILEIVHPVKCPRRELALVVLLDAVIP